MSLRVARPADETAVRRLVNGANLTVPSELSALVADGRVIVAVTNRVIATAVTRPWTRDESDTVSGEPNAELPASGMELAVIAVVPGRRGQGIGRRLVARVRREADGPVVAWFHPLVRPFYDALGFEIHPTTDDDRLFAVAHPDDEADRSD